MLIVRDDNGAGFFGYMSPLMGRSLILINEFRTGLIIFLKNPLIIYKINLI